MVTTLISGLTIGAVYVIVAIGYNIVFTATKVFNFAQAQFIMLGAFVALEMGRLLELPLIATVLVCVVLGGLVGALEEIVAIRKLSGKGAHSELVTTLGVGTVMAGLALVFFGSEPKKPIYFSDADPFDFLGGRATLVDLGIIVVAILLAAVAALVTRKTMVGLSSLAASEDREAAMLRGVNVTWLAVISFAIAGALLAAVGPLVAAKTYAVYSLGDHLAVKSFVALAIGGFGNYSGAVIGGFSVGLLEMLGARYLGSEWQNISVFVLLLIVLLVLPGGVTGRKQSKQRLV